MIEIVVYADERGESPFARWFDDLDPVTAARIDVALLRIETGNMSSLKGLGAGLSECRLDFGPGYRLYLSRRRHYVIVLLSGGTKRRQSEDIARARTYLADYERRLEQRAQ